MPKFRKPSLKARTPKHWFLQCRLWYIAMHLKQMLWHTRWLCRKVICTSNLLILRTSLILWINLFSKRTCYFTFLNDSLNMYNLAYYTTATKPVLSCCHTKHLTRFTIRYKLLKLVFGRKQTVVLLLWSFFITADQAVQWLGKTAAASKVPGKICQTVRPWP